MLRVFSNSAPDGVNKIFRFVQALTKKSLESLSANKEISLIFYLTLVLLPVEQSSIFQEANR